MRSLAKESATVSTRGGATAWRAVTAAAAATASAAAARALLTLALLCATARIARAERATGTMYPDIVRHTLRQPDGGCVARCTEINGVVAAQQVIPCDTNTPNDNTCGCGYCGRLTYNYSQGIKMKMME